MSAFWDVFESPIGPLTLSASEHGLSGIAFPNDPPRLAGAERTPEALAPVAEQLEQYFAGERRAFELALDLAGSEFQVRIWRRLQEIHYGETVTYSEVAEAVGRLDVLRGVAAAIGRTPIPIVIPCHRVVGAGGALTGYGGGLDRKRELLLLESCGARQLSLLG